MYDLKLALKSICTFGVINIIFFNQLFMGSLKNYMKKRFFWVIFCFIGFWPCQNNFCLYHGFTFSVAQKIFFSDVQALLKSLLLATLLAVSKSVADKILSPGKILKRKDTNIDLQKL